MEEKIYKYIHVLYVDVDVLLKVHVCNSLTTLFFRHDVIPIVMGARPEDYAVSAPYKSYIHVDDFDGPKELADYLHKLDQDDQLYNEYFKWKVCLVFC